MHPLFVKFFWNVKEDNYDFRNLKFFHHNKCIKSKCDVYWWKKEKEKKYIELYLSIIHNTKLNKIMYRLLYVFEYFHGCINYKEYKYPNGYELSPYLLHNVNTTFKFDASNILWKSYKVVVEFYVIQIYEINTKNGNNKLISEYYPDFLFDLSRLECYFTYEGNLLLHTPTNGKNGSHVLIEWKSN